MLVVRRQRLKKNNQGGRSSAQEESSGGLHGCSLQTRMYGKLFTAAEKKIMLTRVSPQASGKGRKSDSLGASFRPLRQRRYNPAVRVSRQWTHTAHTNAHTSTRVKHTQPPLPTPKKKKNEAWNVGPWLLAPRLGS